MNPQLNKKVKKYLDAYLKGTKTNSPEHQESVMLIMRGALTDANFHSEAKQLGKYFPKASKKYIGTPMEGVIESKGTEISKMAKYDGHDIIDAFAFYLSMSIGGSFGNRLMSLKESIEESLVEEGEKLDEKNVPTDSSKWSYYKAQAKKKFDVYPSAYANGWAAKQYKKAGGGWKSESVNEGKHDVILDKLAGMVKNSKSFMDVGKELKKNGIKYSFGTSPLPMYIIDKPVKIAILNNKYADGAERVVGTTAIGLMESVNEVKYDTAIDDFNKELEKNSEVKKAAKHYKKSTKDVVKALQSKIKVNRYSDKSIKQISIDYKEDGPLSSKVSIKLSKDYKQNESINEVASRTAMEIGGLTGMNKDAIQKFVDDNKLDIEKLYQFVKKGKLADRIKLVSAIAGKPNNPVQKKMVKQFGESINELLAIVDKFDEKRQSYGKVYYKDMGRPGDINKAKSELTKLRLNPKRKDLTLISVGRNSKMYDVMGESVNEKMVAPKRGHIYYKLTKDTPIKYVSGRSGIGLKVPGVLLHNEYDTIKGQKGAYIINYFNAHFYVDMKNKFASRIAHPDNREQNKALMKNTEEVYVAPDHSDWKKYMNESVNESQLKEFKHKVGSETIQFKVSPYRTGISLIAASGNDLDKLQDVMGSEDEVKGEIRKSLEKKLRIPIEIDRDYEGAGFGFKIDLYALAKMVK